MPARPPAVYLHVGPPKTGTTFIQDVLWLNRETLAKRGLTVPGTKLLDHFHAALDLRGISFGGHDDPAVPGSWERLAAKARGTDHGSVITHEVFAGAHEDQVGRVVQSLAPADVHVVYGARDLARQLPAVWQEGLKNRRTRTFDRFLDITLDPDAAPDRGFWRAQQPLAVLARWAAHVPAERIHVVTLPPAGVSGGQLLWERFCTAVGLDGSGVDLEVARSNASLSVVWLEVLRQLNTQLPADLDWPTYERAVKRRFNLLADSQTGGRRQQVPLRHRGTVLSHAEAIIAGLRAAPYDIVGDLSDLEPADAAFGKAAPAADAKVARAAVSLLAELLPETERGDSGAGDKARMLLGRLQRRGQGAS